MKRRSSHEKIDVAWQCISKRLWKCLVGRYGFSFEERYNESYDDRAYHAKDLDAPAKFAPNIKVRKGNARYRRGYQNMDGGSANNRILTLVKGLIHLLSVNLYLIKRFTKRQVPRGGVYGGLVIDTSQTYL